MKERFEELYRRWRDETCFMSRNDDKYNTDSFRAIVEMGVEIVPLIIQKFEEDSQSYFLVEALDRLCPGILVIEGYVPLIEIVNMWVKILYMRDCIVDEEFKNILKGENI